MRSRDQRENHSYWQLRISGSTTDPERAPPCGHEGCGDWQKERCIDHERFIVRKVPGGQERRLAQGGLAVPMGVDRGGTRTGELAASRAILGDSCEAERALHVPTKLRVLDPVRDGGHDRAESLEGGLERAKVVRHAAPLESLPFEPADTTRATPNASTRRFEPYTRRDSREERCENLGCENLGRGLRRETDEETELGA